MSIPNIEKLFQYLHCVSKSPIEYGGYWDEKRDSWRGGKTIGDKIDDIRLNEHFFDTDACHMCGGCDPAESNVYTKSEYEHIQAVNEADFIQAGIDPKYLTKLRLGLHPRSHKINGQSIIVHVYEQEPNSLYLPTRDKVIDRCTWCFQENETTFRCGIHVVESITCIMPHLRFFHVSGSNRASIGISQFGRNWALKCPVILTPPDNEEQFEINKGNRIQKLERLNQIGLDLNIDTYIPEILDYISTLNFSNYSYALNRNVLAPRTISLF